MQIDTNNSAGKKYKYSEIVDLHDKLTLVVGKSDDQQKIIKYFEDVSNLMVPNKLNKLNIDLNK